MEIRRATRADVDSIVAMLADDPLGARRERPGDPRYLAAFERIDADPNQYLAVVEDDGQVIATLQLSYTAGLSRVGAVRATIEAVRVHAARRGEKLGQRLVTWAVDKARADGCAMVQLTTDASRVDAHRFYQRLGFVASHVGMKLALT